MGELMGEQVLAGGRIGLEASGTENHVAAGGVGLGVDLIGRGGGGSVRVDAHIREILAQLRLERGAQLWAERFAGRTQGALNASGRAFVRGAGGGACDGRRR